MKVLVTGGSGFIGKRLIKALIKSDYQVRLLLSRNRSIRTENHHLGIVECDLLNTNFNLTKVLDDCSVVFNCVGELHDETLMY